MARFLFLAFLASSSFAVTYLAVSPRAGNPLEPVASAPPGMVWISGDEFTMGSDLPDARPDERPAHRVQVSGFWIDATEVTNAQFRAFVAATGHVTTAERPVDLNEIMSQLPPGSPKPAPEMLVPGRWCSCRRPNRCRSTIFAAGGNGRPAPTGVIPKVPRAILRTATTTRWFVFPGTMRLPMPLGPENVCRPKPNGSAQPVADTKRSTSCGETKQYRTRSRKPTSGRVFSPARIARPTVICGRRRSNRFRPTDTACTIWRATCGSGAAIGTASIRTAAGRGKAP